MNRIPTKYSASVKTHHFSAKTSSNYFSQYLKANNIFRISRKPFSPTKNALRPTPIKLSLAKSKSPYAEPKLVSPKTKSVLAEQKRSFTNINFHLVETNFSQPKMSSRSKWKSTIIDTELLIRERNQKHYKQPNHNRQELAQTIKWKWKRPKHTPSKTNTHAKTNHTYYKPQNRFSLFPLLPQRQTILPNKSKTQPSSKTF